jgi:sporulation-control protein
MDFFQKALATVGIGAAKVDTRLSQSNFIPGDLITGEVHIQGGNVAQDLDAIYLAVATRYRRESDDSTYYAEHVLAWHQLTERTLIEPQQTRVVPFTVRLPEETPVTVQEVPVYLKTGLDIPRALDPKDQDYIQVQPHPLMTHVLNAVQALGFQLAKVDCEHSRVGLTPHPFVQEFEFRPIGEYRRRLEELELIFRLQGETLDVFLELDRRARGLSGLFDAAFDMNERFAHFQVTSATTGDLQSRLVQVIESHAR